MDWGRLRERAERLAGLGGALPPLLMGRRRAPRSVEIEPPGPDRDTRRSEACALAPTVAARLIDEARATTLDILGDSEGATSIAARRLRADAKAEA